MKENRGLLRIGDVAGISKVPIHTLRYWESVFEEIVCPHRSEGGQRRYGESTIDKILEIKRLLKEEGYSIAGAKRILKEGEKRKGSALSYQKGEIKWSDIAQEVTEFIQEKLSEGMD